MTAGPLVGADRPRAGTNPLRGPAGGDQIAAPPACYKLQMPDLSALPLQYVRSSIPEGKPFWP